MAGKIPSYLRDRPATCRRPDAGYSRKIGERDWCRNCGRSVWVVGPGQWSHREPKAGQA